MMKNTTLSWTDEGHADLVCLSHLRWGFVYQRPQHLISRFARHKRVFFIEEPVPGDVPRMDLRTCQESGVHVCVPQIPSGLSAETSFTIQKLLLTQFLEENRVRDYILWYYTPMALEFSRHLTPAVTVFDCMDELSAFAGAPREMKEREAEMLRRADVVLTGGQSLYDAKKDRHANCYCLPSSVDVQHFAQARTALPEPEDQKNLPRPRIGFFGVIDERMDRELLAAVAKLRPDWSFVMIGPVVKIDPASLPRFENIHYLGGKGYKELPAYLGGWDVAMLPFAHNESTRFISPTKTPEYLAAGVPVVSTSITDVLRPYGEQRLVRIADQPESFVHACEDAMHVDARSSEWRAKVDAMLAEMSWDLTWNKAAKAVAEASSSKRLLRQTAALSEMNAATMGD
jgi:UDP-galactopyranose mutase